jgi:hypothetical protein
MYNNLGEMKEKLKKPSSHSDVSDFSSFLINYLTYEIEILYWVLPPWALMIPSISI